MMPKIRFQKSSGEEGGVADKGWDKTSQAKYW